MSPPNHHLIQKIAEVMPYDIFRKIMLLVYEPEVEDVSDDSCCVKHTNCHEIYQICEYLLHPDILNSKVSTCHKHTRMGILKISTLNQTMRIYIRRESFGIFCIDNIKKVDLNLRPDDYHGVNSPMKFVDNSLVIETCGLQSTSFKFNPDEIEFVKNKISSVLLRWYDLCFRAYLK